jgi:CheY-like chemotaxis protein
MHSARKAAEVSTLMLTYLGKTDDRRERVDLAATCQRSLVLLRAAVPKRVILLTDLPASGPIIRGSAHQLQQALTNLITNAWEASDGRSGEVRLKLGTVAAGALPEENRFPLDWKPQAGSYAYLEVADAGCGIAAADIERVFDPFYSTKFTGRGLGLSIVLGIARAHGGAVHVESEPGRGSRFRVFFPISAAGVDEGPVAKNGLAPKQPPGRGTLLVVDDEATVRTAVALALRSLGYTVHVAADGAEAVEVFTRLRDTIDCVICDLTMPRLNGWETLAALRRITPGIPVILASGYSEARALEGEHPERPSYFLHKPFELRVLTEAIHQVLPGRGA